MSGATASVGAMLETKFVRFWRNFIYLSQSDGSCQTLVPKFLGNFPASKKEKEKETFVMSSFEEWLSVLVVVIIIPTVIMLGAWGIVSSNAAREACQRACDPNRVIVCEREVAVCAAPGGSARAVKLSSSAAPSSGE